MIRHACCSAASAEQSFQGDPIMRLATFAALATLAFASPALAQTDAGRHQPTISVVGTGEAELKPDFARVFVTVATQADTVAQAASQNRAATERVLARIEGLGIKKDDIQTANFQVFQTPTQYTPDGKEVKAPKFSANHQLQITTRDLDGVGRLAGEILASGDMTFQSVSFGLDRQEEGSDQAAGRGLRLGRRRLARPAHGDPRRLRPAFRTAAGDAHADGHEQGRRVGPDRAPGDDPLHVERPDGVGDGRAPLTRERRHRLPRLGSAGAPRSSYWR
jgi:uncharacterized protein YggE